jgi:hypothetical protein
LEATLEVELWSVIASAGVTARALAYGGTTRGDWTYSGAAGAIAGLSVDEDAGIEVVRRW